MEIIDRIRNHPRYRECYEKLLEDEKEREFCHHDMVHFLDVARIAYIENLEKGLGISKEMIYIAAFLHDIGKCFQYEEGIPHEIASAKIAEEILDDSSYLSDGEKRKIIHAIKEHRKETKDMSVLGRLLYRSDKLSRACYICPVEKECNWSKEKKNMTVKC